MMQCKKYQYKLTEEAEAAIRDEITRMEAEKGENFANAREVRNLFERIITNQASRVADLENVDEDTLTTITLEDLKDDEDPQTESAAEDKPEDTDDKNEGVTGELPEEFPEEFPEEVPEEDSDAVQGV